MDFAWKISAEQALGSQFSRLSPLGGGDFAESYRAELTDGRSVFVKTHTKPPPGFFSTEAAGLSWLHETGAINVPQVLAFNDDPPYLALEWVEIGRANRQGETSFGKQLAQLHLSPFSCFGRPDNRTTGSQAVPNGPVDSWAQFYATMRLLPLAKLAAEKNALSTKCIGMLETLSGKLSEFGAADEPPSLLHGDLWAGNRVVDTAGKSWLIDPAAHGGHREFDLAMMRLFGGYDQLCFDAYNHHFPLKPGWQERVALHQLAPLTVHAIKFGGSYRAATQRALENYV